MSDHQSPQSSRLVGGMWCHEVLAVLSRHLEGDLDADAVAKVTAHVVGCDNCARFGAAYAAVTDAIRGAAADDEASIVDAVLDAVDAES